MSAVTVVIEKNGKDEGAFKTKFTVFYKNVFITLQIKLRQKRGTIAPVPSPPCYASGGPGFKKVSPSHLYFNAERQAGKPQEKLRIPILKSLV